MSTLRELIEKHGWDKTFIRKRKSLTNRIITFKFIDKDEWAALSAAGFHSYELLNSNDWSLYIEPPKPIVFECEWANCGGKLSPRIGSARKELQRVVDQGIKTRVTIEILESEGD